MIVTFLLVIKMMAFNFRIYSYLTTPFMLVTNSSGNMWSWLEGLIHIFFFFYKNDF